MKRQTLSQQRKELESLKKTLVSRQNYIELLSTGALTPKTPGSKNIRCSACQQEGHMRTNKMCPFYRHDNVALADVDAGKIVIPKIKIKKQERVTINLAELKFKSKEALKSKKKWKRKQSKTQVVDLYRPYQKRIRRVRNPEVELRRCWFAHSFNVQASQTAGASSCMNQSDPNTSQTAWAMTNIWQRSKIQ